MKEKHRKHSNRLAKCILALILAVIFPLQSLPGNAFAAYAKEEQEIAMTEGEIRSGFIGEGQTAESEDPSVAWVDSDGNLCAMKAGATVISTDPDSEEDDVTVIVSAYTDGSEIVGNLKILARYNDTMSFYDGHTYLLFTSYEDGITLRVDDLYAGYEISGLYYEDIRKNISNGSNHTGTNADKYFTLNKEMKEVTLDRGEIVTIGMYRDFDLTIPQTAIAMLKNSTLWTGLKAAGKTAVVLSILEFLDKGSISASEALKELKAVFEETGLDYTKLLDGVTAGGVCFNRELYNQKLEWDQYENVTYDMDISLNQLRTLEAALQGNLDKFSLMKNSCATVALRAWNAAVGTRNGERTSYYLDATGTGIYAIMDAPKGVRDDIEERLPGYYLNNANGVEEPGAGYEDETGWVYVSVPKDVDPEEDTNIWLNTSVYGAENMEITVFTENGDDIDISEKAAVEPGTKLYVKAQGQDEETVLHDITVNGESIFSDDDYDAEKDAYSFIMPDGKCWLKISCETAWVKAKNNEQLQVVVGETLNVDDHAELVKDHADGYSSLQWYLDESDAGITSGIRYGDESHKTLVAEKTGKYTVTARTRENEYVEKSFLIEVFEDQSDMMKITFDNEGWDYVLYYPDEDGNPIYLTFSGFYVQKGTRLFIETLQMDSKVISKVIVNGKSITADKPIIADQDLDIKVEFSKATIEGLPEKIFLDRKGDIYQLDAKVSYSGKIYDPSIRYESSDSIVEVNDFGRITVKEDIPEEGAAAIITAYAGSGNDTVSRECKVILGNYQGDRVVGRLTIHARSITPKETVGHGSISFTAYEDTELEISYDTYFKPTQKYIDLMIDADKNPEKYASDPALYSEDPDLGNRESYYEALNRGTFSEPETISIQAGETISMSNYGFESSHLLHVVKALEGSIAEIDPDTQKLIEQIHKYLDGEEIDGEEAYDSMVNSLMMIYMYAKILGINPADGTSAGGLQVNREMYNQFRRNDSQMPNSYYSVELTADEFAEMQKYLSDPKNNCYALFTRNCAAGARDIWNTALSDRPDLHVKADYIGFAPDSQSLYFELLQMGKKVQEGDDAGINFYPRSHYAWEEEEEKPVYSHEWVKGIWYNTDGTQTYKGIGRWKKTQKGWTYVDDRGWQAKNRWQKIDGKWYFFDSKGIMEADAYRKGYYLTKSGAWDEEAPTGKWKKNLLGWRYVLSDKTKLSDTWKLIDGKWYYFHKSGYAGSDEFIKGWWLNSNCSQTYPYQSKWHKDSSGWWYGDKSGWYAKSNAYFIDEKIYFFDSKGYCLNP